MCTPHGKEQAMSTHPNANTPHRPHLGELVHDHRAGRDGIYMGTQGGQLYLRPPGGGIEWTARPEHIGPAADSGPQARAHAG